MSDRLKGMIVDRDDTAKRFAERVVLAKMTLEDALKQTVREWKFVQRWLHDTSIKTGSFLFMCDEFDLEPDAVRKAIAEKRT